MSLTFAFSLLHMACQTPCCSKKIGCMHSSMTIYWNKPKFFLFPILKKMDFIENFGSIRCYVDIIF